MVKIYQAKSKEDFEFARELFFEFLTYPKSHKVK